MLCSRFAFLGEQFQHKVPNEIRYKGFQNWYQYYTEENKPNAIEKQNPPTFVMDKRVCFSAVNLFIRKIFSCMCFVMLIFWQLCSRTKQPISLRIQQVFFFNPISKSFISFLKKVFAISIIILSAFPNKISSSETLTNTKAILKFSAVL